VDEGVIPAAARLVAAMSAYRNDFGPRQLCLSCVDALPVDGAAIALAVTSTTFAPLSASDETAARIEEQQALAGEGPAFDAVRTGDVIVVDDVTTGSQRWPGFAAVLGRGARGAMFAFPLTFGAVAIGALDLYRAEPGRVSSDEVAAMRSVTDAVTTVLLSQQSPLGADDDAGDAASRWWNPAPSSLEVHQATGMVVAQLRVPPSIAYLRLRAHAFTADMPLVDVARDVVSRRLRFDGNDTGNAHG
jgi:hypothetical protein